MLERETRLHPADLETESIEEVEDSEPMYGGASGSNVEMAERARAARATRSAETTAQVQGRFNGPEPTSAVVRDAAAEGIADTPTALPYADQIQESFGRHDISAVRAHTGERSAAAADVMGATAFASGTDVGFAGSPDLHTTAHEAAHVVQQRGGVQLKDGVGEAGDEYEHNADRVADRVVRGESAQALLDTVADSTDTAPATAAVQHDKKKFAEMRARFERPAKKPTPPPRRRKKKTREAPSAKPKKKKPSFAHIKARSKKAPAVPEAKTEPAPVEQTTPAPLIEEELLEEIPPESNEEAKERIEKGMGGIDHLKTAIGTSEAAWKKSQAQPEPEPEPETEPVVAPQTRGGGGIGAFFRSLRNMFKSKSSPTDIEEVMANLPAPPETETEHAQAETAPDITHEYEAATGKLDTLRTDLSENTERIDGVVSTGEYIAQEELADAKGKVDETAGEIRGKVEDSHVDQLHDVGVGILDGDDAMLNAAFDRGGVDINALKIVKLLGKGGSGALVYTAKYMNMVELAFKNKNVRDLVGNVEKVDEQHEMRREQRIMRELGHHPNILRSGGDTDRPSEGAMNPGYVMEKTAFGSLKAVFDTMTSSKMTTIDRLKVTRFLVRQAFNACSALHAEDYVHSDIKDDNFLLDKDMQVKMMDFGLTHKSREQDTSKFQGNERSGTAEYMAPEVVGGAIPEKESDIWSLGEMLLRGVFNWDSVDFLQDEKVKTSFGKEMRRPGMSDQDWQNNLETKANAELAKQDQQALRTQLLSFVQAAMTKKPEDRITAAAALNHPFLQLSAEDDKDAKALLATVT